MVGDEFSFETLSKQEALERKQPKLTKMELSFWEQLQTYLETLSQSLRNEQARNPSSRKIALLQDELRNATRKAESLWEAREKKITLHALKNARALLASEVAPPENCLRPEMVLFADLVATLRKHVPRVVTSIERAAESAAASRAAPGSTAPAPPSSPSNAPPAATPSMPSGPPVTPAAPAPAPPPGTSAVAARPSDEPVTVRALVDVPPFVGLDGKTYKLKKGDVLTLPRKMVDMLAKRGQVAVMA